MAGGLFQILLYFYEITEIRKLVKDAFSIANGYNESDNFLCKAGACSIPIIGIWTGLTIFTAGLSIEGYKCLPT